MTWLCMPEKCFDSGRVSPCPNRVRMGVFGLLGVVSIGFRVRISRVMALIRAETRVGPMLLDWGCPSARP